MNSPTAKDRLVEQYAQLRDQALEQNFYDVAHQWPTDVADAEEILLRSRLMYAEIVRRGLGVPVPLFSLISPELFAQEA